ncbi:MAG: DNA polymerase III subunit gamma/tau [Candidatus Eremiobacteraeota bacterium]|nr:DNA polymerase III subunit gamma/tau [Candidatus Eremiobacteraeota bacterium]
MSLYRTWRPKSFADLVGQDAVVRTLTSAIESGKLAHAYMFSGPRGCGKTSAAKILARCIDCERGPTAHPDNTCENCIAMLNGTAFDVLEIDAASNRGIDEIRALRDAVKFAPSVMRMKVYIIDEAHMLTKEGANAFLKTLEEPPAHAVFILATTEPEKLPVTILSRCQRYAFRRIAIPVMIERMREIARYEGIVIDEPALAAIAYRADGGLRDALTMLEQASAFAGGAVNSETIELAFGASGRAYANALLDAVLDRDASAVLRTVEEASDSGSDMLILIRSLLGAFRNLLVARVNPQLLARDLAPEDADRAAARAQNVAQATIVRALRVLTEAASLSRSGGNPRLELETALLRFTLASEDPTLEAVSARLAALEETGSRRPLQPPPLPVPAPTASATPPQSAPAPAEALRASGTAAANGPVTVQKVRAAWNTIRGKVEAERVPLRVPLSRALVDAVEGNAIVLKLPDPFSVEILRDHCKALEGAIADVLGTPLKVILKADGTAAKSAAKSSDSTPAQQDDTLEDVDALFNYANERIPQR